MSFLSFLRTLPHMITKNQLAKSCELISKDLRNATLPAYEGAAETFKTNPPASAVGKACFDAIRKQVKGPLTSPHSSAETILNCLKNADAFLSAISEKSETLYADSEPTSVLTYQKATYLRLVAAIGFAAEYALRFLEFIYRNESLKETGTEDDGAEWPPANQAYIDDYFDDFIMVLNALATPFHSVEKNVDGLPNAIVNELSEKTLLGVHGRAKLDPVGLSSLGNRFFESHDISVRYNPFYLIGTTVAHYQVMRYKAMEEELELLSLRKLMLEKQRDGKADAALEKRVQYMTTRINNLRFRKEKLEEKYGL